MATIRLYEHRRSASRGGGLEIWVAIDGEAERGVLLGRFRCKDDTDKASAWRKAYAIAGTAKSALRAAGVKVESFSEGSV